MKKLAVILLALATAIGLFLVYSSYVSKPVFFSGLVAEPCNPDDAKCNTSMDAARNIEGQN